MSNNDQPITVFVEFKVRTATTSLDEWLDVWEKRADAAYEHEPETAAYEAAVNVEDESLVLVFERYENGMAGLETHMTHPSHRVIGEAMGAGQMNERRTLANVARDVPDYGWWARQESAQPARAEGYPLILLRMRFSTSVQRASFIELSAEHARYCLAAEPNTLVYSGAIADDDLEPESPLVKGDLLFVMVCTDDAAVDKHATDPNHLALGEKFAEAGVEIENAVVHQYRTSGRGFLWR